MFIHEIFNEERHDRAISIAKIKPYGIGFLDDALRGIFPNDLILVCAKTGAGKTHFASQLALSFARDGGNVLFYALEADKFEIHRRLLYHRLTQRYYAHFKGQFPWPRYVEWLAGDFEPEIARWENDVQQELSQESHGMDVRYFDEKFTAEAFVKELRSDSIRDKDLIIVDHLHYFDYGTRAETDALREAVHAIRNTALSVGKPIVLLAQLRKEQAITNRVIPYIDDIHGHSDIAKVATTCIMIAPSEDSFLLEGIWPTYFHIAKSRKAAEVKKFVATVTFDEGAGRYNAKYVLGRYDKAGPPEPITDFTKIPRWAKRAVKRTFGGSGAMPPAQGRISDE